MTDQPTGTSEARDNQTVLPDELYIKGARDLIDGCDGGWRPSRELYEDLLMVAERHLAPLSYADGIEAAWHVAHTVQPLPEAPVTGEHLQAFYYGKDCAVAAIRALADPSPATPGREEMVRMLRECRARIVENRGIPANELIPLLAKIDATLKDGR